MIFENYFKFGGEVVKLVDFGNGKGGNIAICGISNNSEVKLSVKLPEELYRSVCDGKYSKVIVEGHLEQRVWETEGGNIKHSIIYVADKLNCI